MQKSSIIGLTEITIGIGGMVAGVYYSSTTGNPNQAAISGSSVLINDGLTRYHTGYNFVKSTYNLIKTGLKPKHL